MAAPRRRLWSIGCPTYRGEPVRVRRLRSVANVGDFDFGLALGFALGFALDLALDLTIDSILKFALECKAVRGTATPDAKWSVDGSSGRDSISELRSGAINMSRSPDKDR